MSNLTLLSNVSATGTLTKDPDTSNVGKDNTVTKFSFANQEVYNKKQDNEQYPPTAWINVEAWNKTGDVIKEYARKGTLVQVRGDLVVDTYEKDGAEQKRYYIKANSIRLLRSSNAQVESDEADTTTASKKVAPAKADSVVVDDIPF